MERLGRRMRRQRGTHRCGGGRVGEGGEQRPIVAPPSIHSPAHPSPPHDEGEEKGKAKGRGEEVEKEVKVAFLHPICDGGRWGRNDREGGLKRKREMTI